MGQLIYNDEIVYRHSLYATYKSTLNDISIRDYKVDFFARKILCLDLDRYETANSGNNDCTMDAAIGISDYYNNCPLNARFALVELRMGYKNASNLDFSNMETKVRHSRDILIGDNINKSIYFIFKNEVAPQALSMFNRNRSTYPLLKYAKSLGVKEYESKILEASELPYIPVYTTHSIQETFAPYYIKPDGFVSQTDYWIRQSDSLRLRYNNVEAANIIRALVEIWTNVEPIGDLSEEFIEMMRESLIEKLEVITYTYKQS